MKEALKLALEVLKDNQHLVADNKRHAYVMEYNAIIEKLEEALAKQEQDSTCKDTFRAQGKAYPRTCKKCGLGPCIGKPKQEQDEPVACWCHKCNEKKTVNGLPFAMTRMIVCPECGNKRCPKASNHAMQCTSSNEPNQTGSVYTTPQQRITERKPLTDEQKAMLINKHSHWNGAAQGWGIDGFSLIDDIEAAYGIKE